MKPLKEHIVPLPYKTYLKMLENSLGSKLFQHFYAEVKGKKTDITQGGKLSCAFFVSSLLSMFHWITRVHGTVEGTQKDLEARGWKVIKKPKKGAVLLWESQDFGQQGIHKHIGFYMGSEKAISHSDKRRCPVEHHWTFHSKRQVELILWNPEWPSLA